MFNTFHSPSVHTNATAAATAAIPILRKRVEKHIFESSTGQNLSLSSMVYTCDLLLFSPPSIYQEKNVCNQIFDVQTTNNLQTIFHKIILQSKEKYKIKYTQTIC